MLFMPSANPMGFMWMCQIDQQRSNVVMQSTFLIVLFIDDIKYWSILAQAFSMAEFYFEATDRLRSWILYVFRVEHDMPISVDICVQISRLDVFVMRMGIHYAIIQPKKISIKGIHLQYGAVTTRNTHLLSWVKNNLNFIPIWFCLYTCTSANVRT